MKDLIDPNRLSPQAQAAWTTPDLAYIRPVVVEGVAAFMICAADGKPLGVVKDRAIAFAAARQHDLEPQNLQ
jgi:hypothetical protein